VRGCPGVVYSNNGKNLVAGEKEIPEGLALFNQERSGISPSKTSFLLWEWRVFLI
jgi:hypothetical protein